MALFWTGNHRPARASAHPQRHTGSNTTRWWSNMCQTLPIALLLVYLSMILMADKRVAQSSLKVKSAIKVSSTGYRPDDKLDQAINRASSVPHKQQQQQQKQQQQQQEPSPQSSVSSIQDKASSEQQDMTRTQERQTQTAIKLFQQQQQQQERKSDISRPVVKKQQQQQQPKQSKQQSTGIPKPRQQQQEHEQAPPINLSGPKQPPNEHQYAIKQHQQQQQSTGIPKQLQEHERAPPIKLNGPKQPPYEQQLALNGAQQQQQPQQIKQQQAFPVSVKNQPLVKQQSPDLPAKLRPQSKTDAPTFAPLYAISRDDIKIPFPVFVASLFKSGTTSIHAYFQCGGQKSVHFLGKAGSRTGPCIKRRIEELQHPSPLVGCGGDNYDVYVDNSDLRLCYDPSINHLPQIYDAYPTATMILTVRDKFAWIDSIKRWDNLLNRLRTCTDLWPEQPPPPPPMNENDELHQWTLSTGMLRDGFYEWHVQHVRNFAKEHPSWTYIEVELESNATASILEERIGISAHCWQHANLNTKKPPRDPNEQGTV